MKRFILPPVFWGSGQSGPSGDIGWSGDRAWSGDPKHQNLTMESRRHGEEPISV